MSFEKQKFKMFFTVKLTVGEYRIQEAQNAGILCVFRVFVTPIFANYTKYLMRDLTDVSEEYEGGK